MRGVGFISRDEGEPRLIPGVYLFSEPKEEQTLWLEFYLSMIRAVGSLMWYDPRLGACCWTASMRALLAFYCMARYESRLYRIGVEFTVLAGKGQAK